MDALENDARNPCVGCGPGNATGLRLAFARAPEGAATVLVAEPRLAGWPGRLHSGMLYTAMLETANWSLWAARGRVGLPTRTSALDARRWIALGERVAIEGRVGAGDAPLVRVEARDAAGVVVAALEREYALPSRAEFLRRMGYEACPPELDEALPP